MIAVVTDHEIVASLKSTKIRASWLSLANCMEVSQQYTASCLASLEIPI